MVSFARGQVIRISTHKHACWPRAARPSSTPKRSGVMVDNKLDRYTCIYTILLSLEDYTNYFSAYIVR